MCDARSKAEFNRMREQQEAEERAKTNQECTFKPKINNKEGFERDNRENVDLFERQRYWEEGKRKKLENLKQKQERDEL